MAELADALDLGSSGVIRAGSIPVSRTKNDLRVPITALLFCPQTINGYQKSVSVKVLQV